MSSLSLIAVAGPSGSGKTTWINQFLGEQTTPAYYLRPGLEKASVDIGAINYRFPSVEVVSDTQAQTVLSQRLRLPKRKAPALTVGQLPEKATVYMEVGFHLDLASSCLTSFPFHRVAVLPPEMESSQWHEWADQVVQGNSVESARNGQLPNIWCTPLRGQVFDPASLDTIWTELTGGAYGQVQRAKGIFEVPDGSLVQIDFVDGLSGSEYRNLNVSPWLDGRPNRFSGLEVVGWELEESAIAQAVLDSCLSDHVIKQYQSYYQEVVSS
ncbi:GTP-binding protein [Euhalothece natronophila Z-M001]|uniref:GTP-binding protein n=1 Tax=Euhalothece natronophila Z-M001 TaxID=522448 RepID=A0A5B8NTK5_9CHRO|nr:GTP-binding protein [Euhalothece natronophila]QDZ41370.1 GTP-binding protein [Euhalothece natronophila Z-M001]